MKTVVIWRPNQVSWPDKSWLPTTLLLLYFAYYVFAIQEIELDPWSLGELMTARTTFDRRSHHLQF